MKNTVKDLFQDVKVNNIKLKSMIEKKVLNLIVLGEAKNNSDYKLLWETLDCYRRFISYDFKVYIYNSKLADDAILKEIIHHYDFDKYVSFLTLDQSDDKSKSKVLTTFLGSDIAYLLNDVNNQDVNLVEYFMLPCIVTNKELLEINDKFLYVDNEPQCLASAISTINLNIDYRRRLAL